MISEQLLQNLYDDFNRREIDRIIKLMDVNVKWENGTSGGFIYGRERMRKYWQQQFETDERERSSVTLKQFVRDLEVNLLIEQIVNQIFEFERGLTSVF
jgi:SnoaL-like domain